MWPLAGLGFSLAGRRGISFLLQRVFPKSCSRQACCWHRGAGPEMLLLSPDAQEGSHDRGPSGPSVDRAKVENFCSNLIQTPSLLCSELMGSHITSNQIQTPAAAAAAHRALGDLGPRASLTCLFPPSPCLLSQIAFLIFLHLRVLASAAPTIRNTLSGPAPSLFSGLPAPL